MFSADFLARSTNGKLTVRGKPRKILGISTDTRTITEGDAFVAITGDRFNGHDFIPQALSKGASCIIYSEGKFCTKVSSLKVKDTRKALGSIAAAFRQRFNIPIIAVCGSCGKTTTKDMIAHALSRRYRVLKSPGTENNDIGLPNTLLRLNCLTQAAVVEVGTNHFGEVSYLGKVLCPNIAVITNIGPSHLEFLKDLGGVCREKTSILRHLGGPRIAVLNADDQMLKGRISVEKRSSAFGVGINSACEFRAGSITDKDGSIEFCVNGKGPFYLDSPGAFKIYNALNAIAIGRLLGLGYQELALAIRGFKFPQDRLSLVSVGGIRFINDTYNSNPLSLKLALEALGKTKAGGRKIFVMGDMRELGRKEDSFHIQAGLAAAEVCDILICVGSLSRSTALSATKAGMGREKIFTCDDSVQARQILYNRILPTGQDVVLVKGSRAMKMETVLARSR